MLPKLAAQIPFADPCGVRPALKAAARPLLSSIGARAAHSSLSLLRSWRGPAAPDTASERLLPAPDEPCVELACPLACADPGLEAKRRRALWNWCDKLARNSGLEPIFKSLPAQTVPYGYALRVSDFQKTAAVFSASGLRLLPWPDLPSAVAAGCPNHYRHTALVHFLW